MYILEIFFLEIHLMENSIFFFFLAFIDENRSSVLNKIKSICYSIMIKER